MVERDKPDASYVEQYNIALRYSDVSDKAKVSGRRTHEHNRVLALDYEAGYVKGSEAHPLVHVRREVTCARKVVQSSRDVNDEVTVDEDL